MPNYEKTVHEKLIPIIDQTQSVTYHIVDPARCDKETICITFRNTTHLLFQHYNFKS